MMVATMSSTDDALFLTFGRSEHLVGFLGHISPSLTVWGVVLGQDGRNPLKNPRERRGVSSWPVEHHA